MTTPVAATPATPTITMSRPTIQYTTRARHGHVQFDWWSSRSPVRHHVSYSPTQDDWAARAPAAIVALAAAHPKLAGFWSDDEIEADAIAHLEAMYGFANVAIEPDPAQPDVPVEKTTLEKAAEKTAAKATSPAPTTSS